jgi:hypothetical protein
MTALRFIPLVALWVAPLAAQTVSRHTLRGPDVALYDLAGTVQLEPGSGDAVTVELTRGGADAAQLKVAEGISAAGRRSGSSIRATASAIRK